MAIDFPSSTYPNLSDYALLAQTGLEVTTDPGVAVNVIGRTYGCDSPSAITGTFVGTLDNAKVSAATTELQALISAINNLQINFFPPEINGTHTFIPGAYGVPDPITGPVELLFVSTSPSDQFILRGFNALSFQTGVTMRMTGPASPYNIFIMANNDLSFENTPIILGNLIATGGIELGISAIPRIINGSVFAFGEEVVFYSSATINSSIVCYAKGTQILTQRGQVAVEDLQVGDMAVCKGSINKRMRMHSREGLKPIVWVGSFKVTNFTRNSMPVCIKANALGPNVPFADLYVSPGHRIPVKGKMVPAIQLVNKTTIVQNYKKKAVIYYHVELKGHSVIVANGLEAESYLDVGNRNTFQKGKKMIKQA